MIIGSGLGGVHTLFDNVLVMGERGPDRISPFFIPMGIANIGAGQVAIACGAIGPNFATVSACATGGHAIGEAWETIRRGDADLMLAGGIESGIHEATLGGFASMKALSTRNDDPAAASRPFDKGRDGFVIGEGGGVLILEALEHAEARGAQPLAELVGYGATADASHITLPAPGGIGAVRAARRAMEKAGIDPTEVDHVNAHATSTQEGDKAELAAIRTLFGDHAPKVAVTANKSMLGHTLGAAGAVEAIATIEALRHGVVPPTINLDDPDDAAEGLDLTPNVATRRDLRVAVSNSFGFGGQNTALVFRRWDAMTGEQELPVDGGTPPVDGERTSEPRAAARGRPRPSPSGCRPEVHRPRAGGAGRAPHLDRGRPVAPPRGRHDLGAPGSRRAGRARRRVAARARGPAGRPPRAGRARRGRGRRRRHDDRGPIGGLAGASRPGGVRPARRAAGSRRGPPRPATRPRLPHRPTPRPGRPSRRR